jgi:galactose oxidase
MHRRHSATLVRIAGAAVVVVLLLSHACRDARRPTEPVRANAALAATAAEFGQWSPVFPSPIVQLHLHLLPDGRTLSWGFEGSPQVWNPATGAFTAVPSPAFLFCAGHDFLPDGRLLVAGGHISDDHGLPATTLFDPATRSWRVGPNMARGRWYPTNTTLPDGEMVTIAGADEAGLTVPIPEVWNGTGWRRLTTAVLALEYYPRTFVAPDGRVFYAGEEQPSRWLDVTGTGSWTDGPRRNFDAWRGYGSAVMYEPGKILYTGGGDPPTNTAEVIDLNDANPVWSYTGAMAYARRHLNATILPTGDVLVTGGTSIGRNNPAGAVHAAELWSPTTGTWTTLASNAVIRMYHSTSLLLPDGRVLHTGSGDGALAADERNYELYSPPYLFRGVRPSITSMTPSVVGYGQPLFLETPDGADIAKVTFIRTGSVTHAFDAATRFVPLAFSQVSGGLSVTLPANGTTAPPGPYMLFLVNSSGVPSIGRILLLQ